MNIRIYQISLSRDTNRKAFCGLAEAGYKVDGSIYDMVWEGEVEDSATTEDIFTEFNIFRPASFTARSLSVSDVVEILSENGSRFYYCDTVGFQEIEFQPNA